MENKIPFSLDEFSRNSEEFYNTIKAELELNSRGKFVALDFETKKHWIGDTASDALKKAKDENSEKLFYLIQIGYPFTFTIQSNIPVKTFQRSNHDFNRAYR